MNYPIWDLTTYGGGFLIALVAVVHVLVSHFAVGGGLFLVSLEKKAYKTDDAGLLEYVKKHSKFFMLVSMVFSGMTGVGIWWTIALLNPAATSSLIHTFVFGWAAEWVFFVGEIVALFIYFYTFGKMDRKNHLIVGWIYFFCAWMSLFLINGIIGYMLTPGAWVETHGFWDGFFNPTFWPALIFRTGISLTLCGVFGFVTAAFLKDSQLRQRVMRICAGWVAIPFILMISGGWWYFNAIPEPAISILLHQSPQIADFLQLLAWVMPILFIVSMLMALRLPNSLQKVLCFIIVGIALLYFGAFEFIRESGRHPFVIYDTMYANQVYVKDVPVVNETGFLATAKWTKNKTITDDNMLEAGRELFKFQCGPCHAIDGPLNDIKTKIGKYDNPFGMDAKLNGLGKLNKYMPNFMGTREERWALANYIVADLNGIDLNTAGNKNVEAQEISVDIPPFDKAKNGYVLLAWSHQGVNIFPDRGAYLNLTSPGSDIFAQLVKRGDSPEIITEGVELSYQLESGDGATDSHTTGTMQVSEDHRAFEAAAIPVSPYPSDDKFSPYPVVTITAKEKTSGKILAVTKTVAPVSTELGCKNCHGGGWKVDGVAGLTAETSLDILEAHDKNSATNLAEKARNGETIFCQSCHADTDLEAEGKPGLLNLSAAIHGWHANFLSDREGMDACTACHPAREEGPTRFFRSHHSQFMDCTNCHGTMENHTLSLLTKELNSGKKGAKRLMENLKPTDIALNDIKPRAPWINEPDCLTCHEEFEVGSSMDAFNTWTEGDSGLFSNRHDQMEAMMCSACHSSPHAVYPATFNVMGENRDSIQPLQYQGNDRPIGNDCTVCHTVQPEFEGHHPNSLRTE